MNREFHYYAVHFLASRAGYAEDEARTIATSSQYVDDAIVAREIDPGRDAYRTTVTQNYLFWDRDTSTSVYLPFHFIPGEKARAAAERRDGMANPFVVTADSPNARSLLEDALRSADLFRIGIALHAYADTWAHQHFTGRLEDANAFDPASLLPAAGHLQALRAPDQAVGRWRDDRLRDELAEVDNRERFLAAARMVYRYLRTSRRESFSDEDFVRAELEDIWRRDSTTMESRIADFRILLGIEAYDRRSWDEEAGTVERREDGAEFEDELGAGYDKLQWIKGELRRRVSGGDGIKRVESGGHFRGSALHRWNEAAKAHRVAFSRILGERGFLLTREGGWIAKAEGRQGGGAGE